jgi:hypothetical protein
VELADVVALVVVLAEDVTLLVVLGDEVGVEVVADEVAVVAKQSPGPEMTMISSVATMSPALSWR